METKTGLFNPPLARQDETDQKSRSRLSRLMERTGKLRWFLTPARVAVSLLLFSLGIWSHSAYDSHVTLQNTQLLQQQLGRANQRMDLLTARLAAGEAQLAKTEADVQGRLSLVVEQLEATENDITSNQHTIEQLNAKHARTWQQWQQEMGRAQRLNEARWWQLRWETQRTFGLLAKQADAARDQAEGANRAIEETRQEVTRTRAVQDIHTRLIDRIDREIQALSRRGDYVSFHFDIDTKHRPVSVGHIQVELKKTTVKKQRYTVILYVGDTKIETKNRSLNELISFTLGEEKRPYYLVVKQVSKDRIAGYLTAPTPITLKLEPASLPERNIEPRRVDGHELEAMGRPL